MRKKQVLTLLLAIALAAGNVVSAPIGVQAKAYVDTTKGSVTGKAVTLNDSWGATDCVYLNSSDVSDENSVTITVDGTTYTKISKETRADSNAFTEEDTTSVTLTGIAATDDIEYSVLKSDNSVVKLTVKFDEAEPTLSTLTLGEDTDIKSNAQTVAEASQTLKIAATDTDGSGVDKIYYQVRDDETKLDGTSTGWTEYTGSTSGETVNLDPTNKLSATTKSIDKYIHVKIVDNVGNETYEVSGKITVDTAEPSCGFSAASADDNKATAHTGVTNAFDLEADAKGVDVTLTESDGSEITAVSVDDKDDSSAVSAKKVTVKDAGKHTIKVTTKRSANKKEHVDTYVVTCYKKVDASAQAEVTKTYDQTVSMADLFTLTDTSYAGTPTYSYVASDEMSAPADGYTALDTSKKLSVGTYYVKATYPASGYYLATEVTSNKLTINKAATGTKEITVAGDYIVKVSDESTGVTCDLLDTINGLDADEFAHDTLSYAEGTNTSSSSYLTPTISTSNSEVKIVSANTGTNTSASYTVAVKVTGFKNYTDVIFNIPVYLTTASSEVEVTVNATGKTYDGNALTAPTITIGSDNTKTAKKYTYISDDGTSSDSAPADAGTYTIVAVYEESDSYGSGTTTVTIAKKNVTFSIADTEVESGASTPISVTNGLTVTSGELLFGHGLESGKTISAPTGIDTSVAGEYDYLYDGATLSVNALVIKDSNGSGTDVTANYNITLNAGKIKVAAPSKNEEEPADDNSKKGSGTIGSGGSGGSDSGSSGTPAAGTTTSGSTEEKAEPTLSTNAQGETIAVDADGKVIVNKVVTIDGSKYITDSDGVVLTGGFYTTKNGNTVYASANGKLAVNKLFSVGGKKYVAKKSGALLKSDFYTTSKGNEVYCNKNGVVITNKVFKVGGNKFVAKKSGAIVKKAWVKVGNKKYYCNKYGIVTKTKKVKK